MTPKPERMGEPQWMELRFLINCIEACLPKCLRLCWNEKQNSDYAKPAHICCCTKHYLSDINAGSECILEKATERVTEPGMGEGRQRRQINLERCS